MLTALTCASAIYSVPDDVIQVNWNAISADSCLKSRQVVPLVKWSVPLALHVQLSSALSFLPSYSSLARADTCPRATQENPIPPPPPTLGTDTCNSAVVSGYLGRSADVKLIAYEDVSLETCAIRVIDSCKWIVSFPS